MDELKQCTVRFNMENPIHQKAWEYLQNRDKKKYTSYSNLIADALNFYFEKETTDAEIWENNLIERISEVMQKCLADVLTSRILKIIFSDDKSLENEETKVNSEEKTSEVDWDFLGRIDTDIKI